MCEAPPLQRKMNRQTIETVFFSYRFKIREMAHQNPLIPQASDEKLNVAFSPIYEFTFLVQSLFQRGFQEPRGRVRLQQAPRGTECPSHGRTLEEAHPLLDRSCKFIQVVD